MMYKIEEDVDLEVKDTYAQRLEEVEELRTDLVAIKTAIEEDLSGMNDYSNILEMVDNLLNDVDGMENILG